MTLTCHVRFGERGRETRLLQGSKVRSAPTPFSPLLANVALHGMEQEINQLLGGYRASPHLIRYADDVRHVTRNEILLAEKGGSEDHDLRVVSLT
jgi:RNA-directed DNA polymerase